MNVFAAKTLKISLGLFCLIGFGAGATPALAQEAAPVLEEVIVTAQKREQSLQDVPISVVALSGETIRDLNIQNLEEFANYIPNFSKAETGIGPILQIRGIASGANQGFEQSVVMYVDDIPLGRGPLARMPLVDLQRVEVLRGPQNVLFGKNSVGGALSFVTARPTDEFFSEVSLSYTPEYQDYEAVAIISGPMTENLRGRLTVRGAGFGGYYDNRLNGREEEDRQDTMARGSLAWDVTDNFDVLLKLEHSKVDGDGLGSEAVFGYRNPFPASPVNPFSGLNLAEIGTVVGLFTQQDVGSTQLIEDRVRDSNADENYELVFDIYELIANWSTDAFTFTSVTGWLEYSEDRLYDGDLTGIDMFTNDFEEDYEQFSQEIRFASNGGGRFDWILGAFYQTWELEALEATKVDGENFITALGALGFPGFSALANTYAPKIFESSSDTWALFGQFGINFTDSLRLTVGGRYTDEEKDGYRFLDIVNSATGAFDIEQALVGACAFASDYYTLGLVSAVTPLPDCPPPLGTGGFRPVGGYPIHDINGEISESEFTPSLIFEWSFSDASMLYAKYDEGFKAGGFDAKAALIADFEFGPEDVKAYEVGSKNTFANGAAQVNAALFYMDYNDLQTSSFNGRSGFVVSNAAKAEVKGFELDTRWQATERLLAYGSVGYVDFEFKEFTEGACNAWESILTGKLICDRSGQTASGTPEWSAVLGLDYLTALSGTTNLRISGNMSYESSYFTDPSQEVAIKQSAYALFNLRIAMEAEKWTLALMGKNLTDETVIEFGTVVPLSFEAGIYAPAYVVYHKPPRTLAVQFDYRF